SLDDRFRRIAEREWVRLDWGSASLVSCVNADTPLAVQHAPRHCTYARRNGAHPTPQPKDTNRAELYDSAPSAHLDVRRARARAERRVSHSVRTGDRTGNPAGRRATRSARSHDKKGVGHRRLRRLEEHRERADLERRQVGDIRPALREHAAQRLEAGPAYR